ncbi:hypothetical protein ANN_07937 [Periplaneta americana]|uniref:Uncharacterized protein n=1 Tax=Periplaneta americana TaxID=6978 RepID=A0ABQ8T006_PERAM|nr:hypothetical protein ANN_07937 [Periplaneta americana]
MAGLCEGGNEPAGSLKTIYRSTNEIGKPKGCCVQQMQRLQVEAPNAWGMVSMMIMKKIMIMMKKNVCGFSK